MIAEPKRARESVEDKGLVHRVMMELEQLNQSGTLPVD
jgi:hypothetical protein